MRNAQKLNPGFKTSSAHIWLFEHLQAFVGCTNGQHEKMFPFGDLKEMDHSFLLLVFRQRDAGGTLLCGLAGASSATGPAIALLLFF